MVGLVGVVVDVACARTSCELYLLKGVCKFGLSVRHKNVELFYLFVLNGNDDTLYFWTPL